MLVLVQLRWAPRRGRQPVRRAPAGRPWHGEALFSCGSAPGNWCQASCWPRHSHPLQQQPHRGHGLPPGSRQGVPPGSGVGSTARHGVRAGKAIYSCEFRLSGGVTRDKPLFLENWLLTGRILIPRATICSLSAARDRDFMRLINGAGGVRRWFTDGGCGVGTVRP